MSTTIIGIRGAKVTFSPMERVEREETDWKNRRPKNEFWMTMIDTVDMLSGRPKRSDDPSLMRIGEGAGSKGDLHRKRAELEHEVARLNDALQLGSTA